MLLLASHLGAPPGFRSRNGIMASAFHAWCFGLGNKRKKPCAIDDQPATHRPRLFFFFCLLLAGSRGT